MHVICRFVIPAKFSEGAVAQAADTADARSTGAAAIILVAAQEEHGSETAICGVVVVISSCHSILSYSSDSSPC